MKQLFLALLGLLTVLRSTWAMEVHGEYYCSPGRTEFSGPDESETYLAPWYATVYSGGDPIEVRAIPQKGWGVDSWYVTNRYFTSSYVGNRIPGTDGKLSIERPYRSDVTTEYIGVKYRYITYKLHYDVGGGTPTIAESSHPYDASYVLHDEPKREGYVFQGWKYSPAKRIFDAGAQVSGESFSGLDEIHDDTAEVMLVAQWSEKSYSIGSRAVNGSVTVEPSANYSDEVTISWTPDSAAGYDYVLKATKVYAGTSEAGTLLATYTSGTSAKFRMSSGSYSANIFVLTEFSRTSKAFALTVTSAGNGSVSKDPDQETYTYGSTVTITATPDAGYDFSSWNDGSTETTRKVTVTETATYRAVFAPHVYTITFDPNGGSSVNAKQVAYKAYLGVLPTTERYHKEFAGWFLDNGLQVGQTTTYDWTIDIKLTARWKDAETVDIIASASPRAGGVVSGGGQYVPGETARLSVDKVNDGYRFVNWTSASDTFVDREISVKVVGREEYTAHFAENTYTVNFAVRNDFPAAAKIQLPSSIRLTYDHPYGELPEPKFGNEDYVFDGWLDKDGQVVTSESVFRGTSTSYLYAQAHKRPTYTISYNGNGAVSGTMPDQEAPCGQETSLVKNQYVRGGYYFDGWTNNVGRAFKDGEVVKDLAAQGETVVLYATWRAMTLAEAMHCDNLEWSNQQVGDASKQRGSESWVVSSGENVGSNSLSCVRQAVSALSSYPKALTAKLESEGRLTFWWKPTGGNGTLWIWCNNQSSPEHPTKGKYKETSGTNGVWSSYEYEMDVVPTTTTPFYVHIWNYDKHATADIDLMTWTPKLNPREYGIRFSSPDAGTMGSMEPIICVRGQVYNLVKNAFVRSGFAFKGWWCSETGKLYEDGVLVFDLAEEGKWVTLTAVWEKE